VRNVGDVKYVGGMMDVENVGKARFMWYVGYVGYMGGVKCVG